MIFETPLKSNFFHDILKEFRPNKVCSVRLNDDNYISLFELEVGDCPLLDYYRNQFENLPITESIVFGDSLFNTYSSVKYSSDGELNFLLDKTIESIPNNKLMILSGISEFEPLLIENLKKKNFKLIRYSTAMAKKLHDSDIEDPTILLERKRKQKIRNQISRSKRAGVTTELICDLNEGIVIDELNSLVDITFKELNSSRDLLPRDFFVQMFKKVKGLDTLLAKNNDQILGFISGVKCGDAYFVLFTAHIGKESLNTYYQSHLLFNEMIKHAASIGCRTIHVGRDPYSFKKQHGFEPVPLYWAMYQDKMDSAVSIWGEKLEERHFLKYSKDLFGERDVNDK